MPTANESLVDAYVRRQVRLVQYAEGEARRLIRIINETEPELAAVVRRFVTPRAAGVGLSPRRARQLRDAVRRVRDPAWIALAAALRESLRALARDEYVFVDESIRRVHPQQVEIRRPNQLVIAAATPVRGRTASEWVREHRADEARRVVDAVQVGLVQGHTADRIARAVVGTRRRRGADGVTERSRQHLATTVRSAVTAVASAARQRTYSDASNRALLAEEIFTATLDSRTTPICRSLDGERFPVGSGPKPPLHFNCRSVRAPLLTPDPIGARPFVVATERRLLREYTERNGLRRVAARADLPHGHKGSFDRYKRSRARDLVGRVPAKVTYQQFLARQPREFQIEVLGEARAKLFREGGLTLDRFVNRTTGRQYTLDELRQREAAAFRRAGVEE